MCVADNAHLPECKKRASADLRLTNVKFTVGKIGKILSKLKPSYATGPDGYPPIFFLNLANVLADPISKLFSILFRNGILPNVWKKAYVMSVFKKGMTSLVENYLLSHLPVLSVKFLKQL